MRIGVSTPRAESQVYQHPTAPPQAARNVNPRLRNRIAGSVLIIVLWVSFGLVALALYFAHSMSLELRAADKAFASLEAEKGIEGAARFVSNLLANVELPGVLPATNRYVFAALPIGDATCWIIGPSDSQDPPMTIRFGLVDEGSKLNINTATLTMLQSLPRVTPELAAYINEVRESQEDDN